MLRVQIHTDATSHTATATETTDTHRRDVQREGVGVYRRTRLLGQAEAPLVRIAVVPPLGSFVGRSSDLRRRLIVVPGEDAETCR